MSSIEPLNHHTHVFHRHLCDGKEAGQKRRVGTKSKETRAARHGRTSFIQLTLRLNLRRLPLATPKMAMGRLIEKWLRHILQRSATSSLAASSIAPSPTTRYVGADAGL